MKLALSKFQHCFIFSISWLCCMHFQLSYFYAKGCTSFTLSVSCMNFSFSIWPDKLMNLEIFRITCKSTDIYWTTLRTLVVHIYTKFLEKNPSNLHLYYGWIHMLVVVLHYAGFNQLFVVKSSHNVPKVSFAHFEM